jgi:chloramphenicol-sensitive protein RarD
MTETLKGVIALVAACTIWGLSALFYKALGGVDPSEVLAHRIVWSLVFFSAVLLLQGRLSVLWAALTDMASLRVIVLASLLISVNWFFFIWAIQVGRATESSLGYYIFPLLAVLIGWAAFGERLSRVQWVAVALAGLAVLTLTIGLGIVPWISMLLATTFGLYGLIKKRLDMGPVVSVTAEVMILFPVALGWLALLHLGGGGAFGADLSTSLLLAAAGPMTSVPLILFSYGARRLAMATVGVVQYINPTLQFFCAVVILGEPFGTVHMVAFSLIWIALALYSVSAFRQDKARRKAVMVSEAEVVVSTNPSKLGSANP